VDITLKQLQIFRTVVVAGSITKASRRLSLSQPSISQQLAKLEGIIGAQLIVRNRTGIVSLTPPGEYWFAASDEMLRRLEVASSEYHARFVDNNLTLRMGITPTLRGRFLAKAARIATEEPGFVKFEMKYALTSSELMEQINLHQLNCALLNIDVLAGERASFAVAELYVDPIAFVAPATVSDDEIRHTLATPGAALTGPLKYYVEVDSNLQIKAQSEYWYRHTLPGVSPAFSATTYPAAVDICAEGLATTHCPLSLVPNLPGAVLERLKFFKFDDFGRNIALVMPKHLLSLPAYARIFHRIADFCRTEYSAEMEPANVRDFSVLIDQPALEHARESSITPLISGHS
jgi:DNA-binding transcriptional LysR family regulator